VSEKVSPASSVVLDGTSLRLADVVAVARRGVPVVLADDPALRERIAASQRLVLELLGRGQPVYGVTTGVGDSADHQIAADRAAAMQLYLVRKCGCGSGPTLPADATRAAILVRANCFARGFSGVRQELVERLLELLAHDVLPLVPEQGSVGASGDLVPGSYIAAALVGEREVLWQGRRLPAAEAWAALGRTPLVLAPKEGLALLNGTMVMAAVGCLAAADAGRLARLADLATALACEALAGIVDAFDPFFAEVKPHPGLATSLARLRGWLAGSALCRPYAEVVAAAGPMAAAGERRLAGRVQDSYSLRCAPHCVGALEDTVSWVTGWLEAEINSSNDNPLFEPSRRRGHSGGNFSGFHVGLAMDTLKTAVASVADLIDRQLALLVDETFSNGLPANLAPELPAEDPERGIHHGFKAVQIAASALAAEALGSCMPMTVFSRSTECHNQDKVSQATIAARQARTVVELAERCLALHLLASCQAVDLRGGPTLLGATRGPYERIRAVSAFVERDRELDGDLARVVALLRQEDFPLEPPAEREGVR
jgi:phenylalanine ammonia-lyase